MDASLMPIANRSKARFAFCRISSCTVRSARWVKRPATATDQRCSMLCDNSFVWADEPIDLRSFRHLAAVDRIERLKCGERHRIVQEANRPIGKQEVRPARMPRAEAPGVLQIPRIGGQASRVVAVHVL